MLKGGFVILCLLFTSICFSAVFTNKGVPKGKVVDTVKCIYSREQTYALYLPSYYTTEEKYPIIYIFEPAARGSLPVRKYKDLAEEFGYILVCSNNSRNGPSGPVDKAANAIFSDTKTRFTIDTSRFYTMGFSGGARVAARLAIELKNIKGVIACGAGFPYDYKPSENHRFTYVGLVGDEDMNYYELRILENHLVNHKISHFIRPFKGDHIWPPFEEMRKAFVYLKFDAMKRKLIEIDSELILNFKKIKLEGIRKEKNVLNQYIFYNNLIKHIKGLIDTKDIENEIRNLHNDPFIKQRLKVRQHYLKIESELSVSLGEAFYKSQEYSIQWWKNKADELRYNANDSSNIDMIMLSKRMINKVYLMAFEDFMNNKKTLSFEQSVRNFKIASLVKPDSPYPLYYLASIYAKNKKDGLAIKMLEKSIDKGFSNLDYLKQDKSFELLRSKKKYIELEKQMAGK